MVNLSQRYYDIINNLLKKILEDEKNSENFRKGAEIIAKSIAAGELLYVAGTGGHSTIAAEECFCRAGVLVPINPMIDSINVLHGTSKTRFLQRTSGYAKMLLDEYYIKEGNVLIIVNAYGINTLTIELALEAKKRGAVVIGITSRSFGRNLPKEHLARHKSGMNLDEIADIVLDCYMPYGDAVLEIDGADQPIGPTATFCNVFTINILLIAAVEELIKSGVKPKIWRSINMPNGDEYNKAFFEEYGKKIKYLL